MYRRMLASRVPQRAGAVQGCGELRIGGSSCCGTGQPTELNGLAVRSELVGPERRLSVIHRELSVEATISALRQAATTSLRAIGTPFVVAQHAIRSDPLVAFRMRRYDVSSPRAVRRRHPVRRTWTP
jgi:hypothetical protein